MPRNVEAEAALLGAMMIDNRIADDVGDQLGADDFYEPLHGRLFSAIRAIRANDGLATPITLRPMFEGDPAMEQVGGVRYLAGLTGSGAGLIGARQFAKQILDLAKLRALVAVGRDLVSDAVDTANDVDPAIRLERAELALASLSERGDASPRPLTFAQAFDATLKRIEQAAGGSTARGALITGLPEWNEITGGMSPGQLILLGGRPGMGKTAVALRVGRGAAEAGHGVLFISREMPVDQLMLRIIADMLFEAGSKATFDDVLEGRLSELDWRLVMQIRQQIDTWPLVFEEPPRLNAARVASIVRRHQRKMAAAGQKLAVVIVDYLGLLDAPVKRPNREQEMGDTSRELKSAARATGTAVLALAQLNRGVEQREDKRPLLSDLRDSGSLEQDADTVVFAYRGEYYLRQAEPDEHDPKRPEWEAKLEAERNRLEIYSSKVRQGAPQRRRVNFFGSRQAIRSDDYYRSGPSV